MRTERQFMHDLASPLSVALGMVERLSERLGQNEAIDPKDRERIGKAMASLLRVKDMMSERRNELISEEEKNQPQP